MASVSKRRRNSISNQVSRAECVPEENCSMADSTGQLRDAAIFSIEFSFSTYPFVGNLSHIGKVA